MSAEASIRTHRDAGRFKVDFLQRSIQDYLKRRFKLFGGENTQCKVVMKRQRQKDDHSRSGVTSLLHVK